MTWTYNLNDLDTNEKDQIRLEIGDTDNQAQLLQDEEINHNITVESNFWGASARSCEQISRLFLRKADVRLGRAMMVTYTKMAEQYIMMAVSLRKKALGTVAPYVGGMSVTEKLNQMQNTDLVQPLFTKTMMQNPQTGGYQTDSLDPVGGGTQIPEIVND